MARASRRREWLRCSRIVVGLGCLLGWPPARPLACNLAMGGGLLLLLRPRGMSDERMRATWSSLRSSDPGVLERDLRRCHRNLFGSRGAGRIELVESRFRAALGHRSRGASVPCTAAMHRALEARYASAHFEPVTRDLPPDHITVELHFLGHLLEKASDNGPDAWRAIREARSFLSDHILSWLPALRAALAARPDGGFYLAIVATAEANARALWRDLA